MRMEIERTFYGSYTPADMASLNMNLYDAEVAKVRAGFDDLDVPFGVTSIIRILGTM